MPTPSDSLYQICSKIVEFWIFDIFGHFSNISDLLIRRLQVGLQSSKQNVNEKIHSCDSGKPRPTTNTTLCGIQINMKYNWQIYAKGTDGRPFNA